MSLSHEHYIDPEQMNEGTWYINSGRKTLGGDSSTVIFCEIVYFAFFLDL